MADEMRVVTWSVLVTNWLWLQSAVQPQTLVSAIPTPTATASHSTPFRRESGTTMEVELSQRSIVDEKEDSDDYALPRVVTRES